MVAPDEGAIGSCEASHGDGPTRAPVAGRCDMNDEQRDTRDALCPHCGAGATWRFLDETEQVVEVVCPDCGRIEVPRAEFEEAEFDIVPADERRE